MGAVIGTVVTPAGRYLGTTLGPANSRFFKEGKNLGVWALTRGGGLPNFEFFRGVGLELDEPKPNLDRSDWRLNPVLFRVFQEWAMDAYGMKVVIDVFASESNRQLPIFGVPALQRGLKDLQGDQGLIYVNGDWADYKRVIPFIKSLGTVALVVAPLWTQFSWFEELVGASSHFWRLEKEKDTFLPVSKGHKSGIGVSPWEVGFFIADFRPGKRVSLVKGMFPTIGECRKVVSSLQGKGRFKEAKITQGEVFKQDIRNLLKPAPFNIPFLTGVSKGAVPDGIRDFVLTSITHGFRSGYKGGSQILRDYSRSFSTEELAVMKKKLTEDVSQGFCLGPFDQSPFPSKWCSAQPIICLQFLRPKHKFKDLGKFRLISHRSFPKGRSFNDLIPRNDSKTFNSEYEYFTVADFLKMLGRLGRGTLIGCFDVKDAYKQCRTHPEDLWQQVYKVGDVFYVDTGGMFGSRNARGIWSWN